VTKGAIDIVVNPLTPRIVAARPAWMREFHTKKIGRAAEDVQSVTREQMLAQMDVAGIDRAFLAACKLGQEGTPGAWHMPYEWVAEATHDPGRAPFLAKYRVANRERRNAGDRAQARKWAGRRSR
jgi:hypothetical protein